jgi:hypothetical protein
VKQSAAASGTTKKFLTLTPGGLEHQRGVGRELEDEFQDTKGQRNRCPTWRQVSQLKDRKRIEQMTFYFLFMNCLESTKGTIYVRLQRGQSAQQNN